MLKLKSCPMCGAKEPTILVYIQPGLYKYAIQCNRCRFEGKKAWSEYGAFIKWNRIKVEGEER